MMQHSSIPDGLDADEVAVYQKLIGVVESRKSMGIDCPHLAVITDLAKDYDDLTALVLLKELHRLGVVKLEGLVANMNPSLKRAQFGRGALDSLGLQDVPIAAGTIGSNQPEEVAAYPYEFGCSFMAAEDKVAGKGHDLLRKLCETASKEDYKLTFLLISCLQDIDEFATSDRELLQKTTSQFVLLGGYAVTEDGNLEPDEASANNRFHMPAARRFHQFLRESGIPSTVFTKVAAFATPLLPQLYADMAETQHEIGQYLRRVHISQDLTYYKQACEPNPADRFAPFYDQEWCLRTKTRWYDEPHEPGTPLPVGEEVIPYLTRVIVYDALAALGTSGSDAIEALNILLPAPASLHRVIGDEKSPGIRLPEMTTAMTALLKGSLLACQQGLK